MESITKEKLKNIELFNRVQEETLKFLEERVELRTYEKGSHIFRDRDEVKTIYIVLSGKVALYKINEKAQKRVIFILGEGKLLNEVIIKDLPASINCEVFEKAKILCYDKDYFIEMMKKDFELTQAVISNLSTMVRRMYRQLKNATAIIKIEKRIAAKLWKLGRDYGIETEEGILIDMGMSITYLADLFGAPRETISKGIKVLCNENLIRYKNKKILIRDSEKLSKYFKAL